MSTESQRDATSTATQGGTLWGVGAFVVALAVSIALSHLPYALTGLWYANAVGTVLLLRQPVQDLWKWLLILAALLTLCNQVAGNPWPGHLLYVPGSLVEMTLAAHWLRPLLPRLAQSLDPRDWLPILVKGGLLPALAGALVAATTLSLGAGQPFVSTALGWFTGTLVGSVSLLPFGLLLVSSSAEVPKAEGQVRTALVVLACLVFSALCVVWTEYPYVYVTVALSLVGATTSMFVTGTAVAGVSLLLGALIGTGLARGAPQSWSLFLPLVFTLLSPQLLAAAMARLRAHERRLIDRYERAPVMQCAVDAEGRLLMLSDALVAWLGRPRSDLVGQALARALGWRDEALTRSLRDYLASLQPQQLREWRCVADLDVGRCELRVTGLQDSDVQGRTRSYLLVLEDLSEQARLQASLRRAAADLEEAQRDSLTGLPMRAPFERGLQRELQRAERMTEGASFALIFLDLDGLKDVNDRYGHESGDALLKETARRLLRAVRASDLVCRLGGDEFVVLHALQDDAQADAATLQVRLVERVEGELLVGPHALPLRVSAGVALYPRDGRDAATLLKVADARMYECKAARKAARKAPR